MLKLTIHVGCADSRGRLLRRTVDASRRHVARLAGKLFGGATVLPGWGVWQGALEPTVVIIVYLPRGTRYLDKIETLVKETRQSEIWYTVDTIKVRKVQNG